MVVIQVKTAAEQQEFLYECPCSSTVDEVADAITQISALQSHLQTLCFQLRRCLLTDDLKESSPEVALALDRTLSEAEIYASKDQVLHKRALSPHILKDHLQLLDKEVWVAHSKGLCDAHVIQLFSDCKHNEDTQLWWAGKELIIGKNLCDYIGSNEKTKIVVRLKPVSSSS